MNPESSSSCDPSSPGERWIDAALTEHARLGRAGADEELVLRILRETVHRAPSARRPLPRVASDWRFALAACGAAAALIALVLVSIRALPFDPGHRHADELRFVVRLPEAAPGAAAPGTAAPGAAAPGITPPPRAASPHRISGEFVASPPAPAVSPGFARVDLEMAPGLSLPFGHMPRKGVRHEDLRISADRSESSSGALVYEGGVIVEHERFRIEAQSVRVPRPAPGSGGENAMLASRVRLVQDSPHRLVVADRLRFDPVAGSLELSGVKQFESERGALARFAPGDRLILSGEGFSVESAPVEVQADVPARRP